MMIIISQGYGGNFLHIISIRVKGLIEFQIREGRYIIKRERMNTTWSYYNDFSKQRENKQTESNNS